MNVTRVVGSLALALGAGICGGVGASGVVAAQEAGAARSESAGSTRAHNPVGEDSRGLWSIDYTVDEDESEYDATIGSDSRSTSSGHRTLSAGSR